MHDTPGILHDCPNPVYFAGVHIAAGDFPLHQHDYWEVIVQRTGHIRTQQAGIVYDMHPGSVLVHPPGVPHCDYAGQKYCLYYILLRAPDSMPWPTLCHDDPRQSILHVCEGLYEEYERGAGSRELMLRLLAGQLDILLRRAREEQRRTPGERLVAQAGRILEERLQDPPTGDELARELGTSRSTLYAQFAAVSGQTPSDYVRSLRLQRALALLHGSDVTLDVVAEMCGYDSASHLSRHVREATGTSPGRLRKELQPSAAGTVRS